MDHNIAEKSSLLTQQSSSISFVTIPRRTTSSPSPRVRCPIAVMILSILVVFSYYTVNLTSLYQLVTPFSKDSEAQVNQEELGQNFIRGNQTNIVTDHEKHKMKLSLWLVPPGVEVGSSISSKNSVYERAIQVIDELSATFEGPKFIPHVTIVGGITVDSKEELSALSRRLREGLANFGTIGCIFEDIAQEPTCWNQALIVEMIPSERFLALCRASRRILNMELETITFPPPAGVPHMSLFYGDSPLSDPTSMTSQDYVSRIFDGNGSVDQRSFEAHRVMLWKTDPSSASGVPEWEPMADISLL
eukprot:jgi/Psemu1/9656/gm1.9656_g